LIELSQGLHDPSPDELVPDGHCPFFTRAEWLEDELLLSDADFDHVLELPACHDPSRFRLKLIGCSGYKRPKDKAIEQRPDLISTPTSPQDAVYTEILGS
jgi:hypothetical protein